MQRFKNILLVCNFDLKQQAAVDRAVSLANQNEAHLTVFSVVKELLPADARMAITSTPPRNFFNGRLLIIVNKSMHLPPTWARKGLT